MTGFVKNLNLIFRIITIPAVVSGITIVLLYYPGRAMTLVECLMSIFFLTVFPAAAYPLSEFFNKTKPRRERQRSTALVFSVIGYIIGFAWALSSSRSKIILIVFFSYVFSSIVLIILNKLKYAASGHACSTTAPTVFLSLQFGLVALLPCLVLIAVVYISSIKLKRHTIAQLITGSAISLISGLIGFPLIF